MLNYWHAFLIWCDYLNGVEELPYCGAKIENNVQCEFLKLHE